MIAAGIPTVLEELTPEWLTEVLREAGSIGGASVTAVNSELLGEGRGFTGRVVRVRLEYDSSEDGDPHSLIAKLPSADSVIRTKLNDLGVYEREFRFYTEIGASPELPIPRLYYARLDLEAGMSILLLEDLAQSRAGDNVAGCSDEDAYLAVSRLARLQAAWWENPRLREMTWLIPLDPDRFQEVCQGLLAPFLQKFDDVLTERLRELARRLVDHVAYYRRWLDDSPRTIVHGDFRLDNLLFGAADGEPLTIIDWQVSLLGHGVVDVAYFAAFCLPKEQRRAIERQMVQSYHAALLGNGVVGYDLDQCWEDYRFATLSALLRLITAGALLDFSSERGRALTMVLVHRIDAILVDHNVGDLLPSVIGGEMSRG